jgi:hypothetical protein
MNNLKTNKNTNLLNLKIFSNKDNFGNYDLNLNKNLVSKFVKNMINRNWDMETKTAKIYKNNNFSHSIYLPDSNIETNHRVYINKCDDIYINDSLSALLTEYKQSVRNNMDFPCKKDYHCEKVRTVFHFKNPNKKIIVNIIDDTQIEFDLVLDHEKDVTLRIANDLITDSGLDTLQ